VGTVLTPAQLHPLSHFSKMDFTVLFFYKNDIYIFLQTPRNIKEKASHLLLPGSAKQ
jgi:hypothetical protein